MFNLLFDNTSMPLLEKAMVFSEQRQAVLAENVANLDTPGYRQTDLDVAGFQMALLKALDRRDSELPRRFEPESTRNVRFSPRLDARRVPVTELMNYYDGANRSVERLMNEMGKNALWHNVAAEMFRQQADQLETAIRERIR